MTPIDYEFYETPNTFSRWLFKAVRIEGRIFEPCVGGRAIPHAAIGQWPNNHPLDEQRREWITNDLDERWLADYHRDATEEGLWTMACAHHCAIVSNPPFTPALEIIARAIEYSRVGVAMHLRASIHEVLKTGIRRTWMAQHTPTGILWLPRFGYQRSKTTGKWTTDSVCACWVVWLKDPAAPQFIRYAPEWVIDQLDRETPEYRARMDLLMADRLAVTA